MDMGRTGVQAGHTAASPFGISGVLECRSVCQGFVTGPFLEMILPVCLCFREQVFWCMIGIALWQFTCACVCDVCVCVCVCVCDVCVCDMCICVPTWVQLGYLNFRTLQVVGAQLEPWRGEGTSFSLDTAVFFRACPQGT